MKSFVLFLLGAVLMAGIINAVIKKPEPTELYMLVCYSGGEVVYQDILSEFVRQDVIYKTTSAGDGKQTYVSTTACMIQDYVEPVVTMPLETNTPL